MSNELKPALSPEGWREQLTDTAGTLDRRLGLAADYASNEVDPVSRHGLAALCLYGQPFGFTQKDISDLERCMQDAGWAQDQGMEDADYTARMARLEHFVSRIAALLPPPSDTTT